MIISFEHEFIFLATRGTDSDRIERALTQGCGPLDVITPLKARDQRINAPLAVGAQNYVGFRPPLNAKGMESREAFSKALKRQARAYVFLPRMSAAKVREIIGQRIWERFTKFAIDRNPWARVATGRLNWAKRNNASVADLRRMSLPNNFYCNSTSYCIDNKLAVDKLFRYETLSIELPALLISRDIPFDMQYISRANTMTPEQIKSLFDAEAAEQIGKRCSCAIKILNYDYEATVSPSAKPA